MKSGTQIAAISVTVITALWHVVWWGMMSPTLIPPRHEQPTTHPIRLVDTIPASGDPGAANLDARSLRNPTLFAFPGGPGFSSFLLSDRFGLSPRLAPMDFSVSAPAPASTSERVPALVGSASLTPERWLSSAQHILPLPTKPSSMMPIAPVRVGFRGIDPTQLRAVVDWQGLASLDAPGPWTASAEVEFSAGRPTALMFAAQHSTPASVLPVLRRNLMDLRAIDPSARFSMYVDIAVTPTAPPKSSTRAP